MTIGYSHREVLMGNLVLDNNVLSTIAGLAERLKTSKEDIVRKAIEQYSRKLDKKNHLMSFAGSLKEEEADELLDSIYSDRRNKDAEFPI